MEQLPERPSPSGAPESASHALLMWRRLLARFRALPRAWQWLLLVALLTPFVLILYPREGGSARLHLTMQHGFRSAEVSLALDNHPVYKGVATGTVRKRFGFMETVQGGTFSAAVPVPSGRHTVQVTVNAPGYHQMSDTAADFDDNSEKTLAVNTRHGEMELSWPTEAGAQANATAPKKYGVSVLMTVWGSAISAAVGFFIQEFLRSRLRSRQVTVAPERIIH